MPRLLLVIQAPSRRDIGWRRALMRRAHEAGWKYGEYWGDEIQGDFDPDHDGVLVTTQFDNLERFGATDEVVLIDHAEEIDHAYSKRLDMGRYSLWPTSGWLARATVARSRGAPILHADASSLNFPYFGDLAPLHPDDIQDESLDLAHELREALALYRDVPSASLGSAVWPVELLRFDQNTFADSKSVELMGRRRVLLFGPYLEIPPGLWTATMEFQLVTEGFSPSLRFEWGTPDDYSFHESDFKLSGRYQIEISHLWTQVGPSDFRVLIDQPVFGGSIRFSDCHIRYDGAGKR